MQVVRKDGGGKSKKRQKLDHGQGGSEVSVGAGMGRSDVSVGEKMEEKGKPRRNPRELDDGSLKLGRPKSNKVYKCAECDYSSARRTRWTEHMGRVHGIITEKDLQRQKQPDFPCNLCDKSFIFEKDLKRHNRIVHTAVSQTCQVCNKTYKSKYVFDKHMATHKEGYVQPMFTCQLCPRSFTTKFMLAHHIKSEHLGLKKTYLCPTCGKSFSQIRSYRQHANVHAGIRPFQCETCGKSFTYEKSLKEHRYMHDNLRRFACKTCGKAFRQYTCLIIHQKTHKDTKDHICSSCGKGFTQKQSLIRHERIHTGDKPYTCSICRKAFSDYAVIRKHMMMCHKKDRDHWKDDIITDVRRPLSSHYITGGPGYVPRETSTKISDYVKPSDATLVNTDNLEPGQPMPHVPGQILPVTVPTTESEQSASEVSDDIIKTNDELFKKVNITDEDAQNALSRLSAVYSGSSLYTSTPSLGQAQDIALLPDIKVQPNSSQEQNQPSQITLLPINYSLSPNYATAVSAARTIDHPLSEEAIANYLKAEVCPKQQPKDYTTVLAPLASLVPVSETQPQKGQGQVTLATPTSGDSILSQAALSAWGYAGYPGYYTPAGFIQYQGQQPQN